MNLNYKKCNFLPDSLRIPIRISLDDNVRLCLSASNFESEDICYLRIHKHTTWDDFSAAVSQAVLNHFSTIMSDGWESQEELTFNNTPESNLGLGAITDLSFRLGIFNPLYKIYDLLRFCVIVIWIDIV